MNRESASEHDYSRCECHEHVREWSAAILAEVDGAYARRMELPRRSPAQPVTELEARTIAARCETRCTCDAARDGDACYCASPDRAPHR